MKPYRHLLSATIALLLFVGVVQARTPQTDYQSIALEGAESARVQIDMGVGSLTLRGGADSDQLMDADFTYDRPGSKPEITYEVKRGQGRLTVQQPGGLLKILRQKRNEWDLRLNNDVPTDLTIDLGVGESDLKLGGLNLTRLMVDMGIGAATVDLTGGWREDLEAHIDGGIGELTLILPIDTGARIEAEKTIGEIEADGFRKTGSIYTNDAFNRADVTLYIHVETGIGKINLKCAP